MEPTGKCQEIGITLKIIEAGGEILVMEVIDGDYLSRAPSEEICPIHSGQDFRLHVGEQSRLPQK